MKNTTFLEQAKKLSLDVAKDLYHDRMHDLQPDELPDLFHRYGTFIKYILEIQTTNELFNELTKDDSPFTTIGYFAEEYDCLDRFIADAIRY